MYSRSVDHASEFPATVRANHNLLLIWWAATRALHPDDRRDVWMKLRVLMRHSRSYHAGCILARHICRNLDSHRWGFGVVWWYRYWQDRTVRRCGVGGVEWWSVSPNKDRGKGKGRIQPQYKQPCASILKDPQRHHLIRLLLEALGPSFSASSIGRPSKTGVPHAMRCYVDIDKRQRTL
jgi:hypothetical protein